MNAPWKQLSSALVTSEILQNSWRYRLSKMDLIYMNKMIFRNPAFQKKGIKPGPWLSAVVHFTVRCRHFEDELTQGVGFFFPH